MKMLFILTFLIIGRSLGFPTREEHPIVESDGETSRKVLGSSVVTSVSVILDSGNGSQAYFSDAVGKPVSKPQTGTQVASPINLLNPDRYEFYTFDDNGDLIKRLMTLDEIQGIIANGDGDMIYNNNNSNEQEQQKPEKHVDEIVNNVQNVLKEEMETLRPADNNTKPVLDTPDVSSTWSMILPAIFGNSGEDIKPVIKPNTAMTPDTITIDTTTTQKPVELVTTERTVTTVKISQEITTKDDTTVLPTTTEHFKQVINTSNVIDEEDETVNVKETKPTQDVDLEESKQVPTLKPSESTPTQDLDESLTNTVAEHAVTTSSPEISMTTVPEADNSEQSSTIVEILLPKEEAITSTTQYEKKTEEATFLPTTTEDIVTTIKSAMDDAESTTNAIPLIPDSIEEKPTEIPIPESTIHNKMEETTLQITTIDNNFKENTNLNNYDIPTTISNEQLNNIATTTFESLRLTTKAPTSLQNQDQVQKVEIAEILNQLLLTTTNIYEINTELSNSKEESQTNPTTTPDNSEVELQSLQNSNESDTKPISESPESDAQQDVTSITAESTENVNVIETFKNDTQATVIINVSEDSVKENDAEKPNKVDVDQTTKPEESNKTSESLEKSNMPQISEKEDIEDNSEKLIVAESTEKLHVVHTTEKLNAESPLALNTTENFENLNITNDLPTEIVTTVPETPVEYNEGTSEIKNEPEMTTILDEVISTTYSSESVKSDITTMAPQIKDETTKTVLASIEELISNSSHQAQQEIANAASNSANIETVLEDSKLKPMEIIQEETATVASQLLDSENISGNDSLEDAFNSLLLQISDETESTTIEGFITNAEESLLSTVTTMSTVKSDEIESGSKVKPTIAYKYDTANESKNSTSSVSEDQHGDILKTEATNDTKEVENKPEAIENSLPINKEDFATNSNKEVTHKTEIPSTQNQHIRNESSLLEEIAKEPANNEEKEKIVATENEKLNTFEVVTSLEKNNVKHDQISPSTTERYSTSKDTESVKGEDSKNTTEIQNDKKQENNSLNNDNNEESSTNTVQVVNIQDIMLKETLNVTNKPPPVIFINSTDNKKDSVVKDSEAKDTSWTLVSTVSPQKLTTPPTTKPTTHKSTDITTEPSKPVNLINNPVLGYGLEDSTSNLDTDVYRFVELCNELAFGFWKSVTNGISNARSVIISPFAANSLLAMVFLGARGATSGEMNEILRLDDMVTFNPHLIFKNVSESIENLGKNSGVAISSIVRELYSDRSKGKLLGFYKERAKQFYDGHVEEVGFKEIGDIVRRRTNMIVKKQTSGRIAEYVKDTPITLRPPLAGVSASIFQTDCSDASTEGRDGELYFVVSPSIRQRRLVPVPAAVWRNNFLAGYDPTLDATAVSIGMKDQIVSTIYVLPGQQGIAAPGDGLIRLEKRLMDSAYKNSAWSRLLRTLIPRPGLEVQIPRFSHRSIINATNGLQRMGLKDLFNADKADLRGLNGVAKELYLSDILQINNFATCAEVPLGETHHSEIYPATSKRQFRTHRKLEMRAIEDEEPRDYQRAFHDPLHDPTYLAIPLPLRPRQARLPETPRLRFDRPFLYFIRHNPTGLILHMGRFNPRLLP